MLLRVRWRSACGSFWHTARPNTVSQSRSDACCRSSGLPAGMPLLKF
ncbi:hypothetical protein [Brevinema andersonii]|nr:hypothetical protein [Brevinema andersonii]